MDRPQPDSTLVRVLSLDVRSLGLFRWLLGALIVGDAVYRSFDVDAFLTDAGLGPRSLGAQIGRAVSWSLCSLSGEAPWQYALLAMMALAGGIVMLGWWTRLGLVLAFVLQRQFVWRFPELGQVADNLLPLMLMWSLFLPLSERFCAPKPWRNPKRQTEAYSTGLRGVLVPGTVFSMATVAFYVQLVFVYVVAGMFKLASPPWVQGSLLIEAMNIDPVARDIGRTLLAYPTILQVGTWLTLPLEVAAPWLVFSPWKNGPLKSTLVCVFMAFHLVGIFGLMRLGLVAFCLAFLWPALLPAWFWDKVSGRTQNTANGAKRVEPAKGASAWVNGSVFVLLVVSFARWPFFFAPNAGGPAVSTWNRMLDVSGIGQAKYSLWTRPVGSRNYVFAATLANGQQIDLHTGRALDWENPRTQLINNHWYKVFQSLPTRGWLRRTTVLWFVRDWNANHGPSEQVTFLQLGVLQAERQSPQWWLRPAAERGEPPVTRTRWSYKVERRDGDWVLVGGKTAKKDGVDWH